MNPIILRIVTVTGQAFVMFSVIYTVFVLSAVILVGPTATGESYANYLTDVALIDAAVTVVAVVFAVVRASTSVQPTETTK